MSNKNSFVISNEHNRIIHYRKTSPPGNKVKSGIIERYTYKSDNGELLPSTSFEPNIIQNTVNRNSIRKYSTTSILGSSSSSGCALTKISETLRIRGNLPQETNKMLVRNKSSTNSSKSTIKNTVRTEHCDSTTDVDMITRNKKLSNLKQDVSDSEESNGYDEVNYNLLDHKAQLLNSETQDNDESDSDCQIVDIEPCSLPAKRKTIIKQMEWMIIADKSTNMDSVQVISDSESDDRDLQSNTLTSSLIPDKTLNSIENRAKSTGTPTYMSDDSFDDKKDDNLEPSIYEISDGIQIILPPKNSVKKSELVLLSESDHDTNSVSMNAKPRFEIISNIIVKSNEFNSKRKSYESDDNPDVSSSEMHLRDQTTPTYDKENHTQNNLASVNKSPKYDPTLSPDSMKTEFYSYLKINTNPLAPKTETIMQNRRSVRVRNLNVQIEKLKEKNELKKEEQKINDVRNKFLKYSRSKINFPSLDHENNTFTDFDEYIEKYFIREGIDYKNPERNKKAKSKFTSNKLFKISSLDVKTTSYDRKLLYKKIFMKQTNHKNSEKRKADKKTNERIFLKRKALMKHKNNLRRLNSSNRILRNRRVTRHSLTSPSQKNLTRKLVKSPIKLKNKKKTENIVTTKPRGESIKSCSNIDESSNNMDTAKVQSDLNPLDKLDLITRRVMSEYSMGQDNYSFSPVSHESKCDKTLSIQEDKFSPQTTSKEIDSNESTCDIIAEKPSPIENCLGFRPDENIHKIRKNIESVLSNIIINPIEKLKEVPAIEDKTTETDLESDKDTIENSSKSHASETSEISREFEDASVNDYEAKDRCVSPEIFNSETIKCNNVKNYIPLNPNITKKSFHHSLLLTPKRKSSESTPKADPLYAINSIFPLSDSEETQNSTSKTIESAKKSRTHEIDIQKQNGPVFNAYYVNCTLIIVQEFLISFWKQTPLGNVLGAQNMWYSIGNIKRLSLERGCINRRSSEMVLNVESSVAYIELWTKEHQSDYRERPISDVFATVYFHKGHGLPDKKVLQLENIKGYGNDVRFAVMKNSREIVVSWFETFSTPAKVVVRSYQLAPDFQTISSTKEMESVEHFILSLHNIGNCDSLVLGAGSEQISVWNLAHGWLSTTVSFEPTSLQIHSMCLWALCETGYLFLLQQIGRGNLRLVAINGVSSQWKQLQIYHIPECYESLLGVTRESGILMTCYTNGFLCFDMQTGDLLADAETPINRIILPSEKFLVSLDDYKVSVKHVMVYVLEN